MHLSENGVEAREHILSSQWDIILKDNLLPDTSGIELVKLLRFKKKSIPVIMLNALGEADNKVEILDFVVDDYLVKPFNLLISRINALVRRTKFNNEDPSTSCKLWFYTCFY
ncbi:DNA-binding response OmpR family regulator [Flavobacterium sp. 7A]|nr:DNA-binding response OmpR family regulator [Flavobacterium sp. 7A]